MSRNEMAGVMSGVFATIREKVASYAEKDNHLVEVHLKQARRRLDSVHGWVRETAKGSPETNLGKTSRMVALAHAKVAIFRLGLIHCIVEDDEPVAGIEKVIEACDKFRAAGQKEYAHSEDNAFGNFERTAWYLGISREMVLVVFMEKHMDGIKSWVHGHKSQREEVQGRICDAIVYLCLLIGMMRTYGTTPQNKE